MMSFKLVHGPVNRIFRFQRGFGLFRGFQASLMVDCYNSCRTAIFQMSCSLFIYSFPILCQSRFSDRTLKSSFSLSNFV